MAAGVFRCSFSPNGQRIVSGRHDQTVKVWNLPGPTAALPVP